MSDNPHLFSGPARRTPKIRTHPKPSKLKMLFESMPSTYPADVTVDQHREDFRKFIEGCSDRGDQHLDKRSIPFLRDAYGKDQQ